MKAWPRQIPPVWQEKPTEKLLIYHFWQQLEAECKTWVILSRIRQRGAGSTVPPMLASVGSSLRPYNKATAGSGVVLAVALIGNKNTEAFLILQRQKLNPPLTQCLPFLSRDQINMGLCKVNGLFQGVLNWAL